MSMPACERSNADRDEQQAALEQKLIVSGKLDRRDRVESDADSQHTDEGADDVKLAVARGL
jgi:hypothetical protein